MKTIAIPRFLHEVFGERQSVIELIIIAIFGVGFTGLVLVLYGRSEAETSLWKTIVAFLLVLDVAAGSIANMTRGTNRYYAERPIHRLVFIAVHIQILAIALLMPISISPALFVWVYTIVSAFIVNILKDSGHQRIAGSALLLFGIAGIILSADIMPDWFQIVSMLFLTKVAFSFAVDHYSTPA